MRLKVLAICFFCSAAAAVAAEPAWELAPPDAKILLGVDVRGLRNSSLTDLLGPQTRAQMQAPAAKFNMPGIELLEDIDSLFLASTGDIPVAPKTTATKAGTAAASNTAAPWSTAPFLLVVNGTFPDEHLRPLLKGPHPSYKGINVYRGTGTNPSSVAVLDEHTVLMGDDKSIYRAIDRKAAGVQTQGPLVARARELAASTDIWIVARDPSGALQKGTVPAMFASEIEGLDMGFALREGFHMNITLATKTEAGAQSLSQLLSMQMQSAVAGKLDAQKTADFWRKVQVSADGKRIQVQVALTKEELQENSRMMQEQRASLASARPSGGSISASAAMPAAAQQSAPTRAVAVQQLAPPKPPQPRTIKIYGLDDGVREIHLDQ